MRRTYRSGERGCGGYDSPPYGHHFTDWWGKYGAGHPEYFALNKYGVRAPEVPSRPEDGEAFIAHKSDRYVYFNNPVAIAARGTRFP